jgi:WD40 repeat protein
VFAVGGRHLFGLTRTPVVDIAVSRGGRIAVASANAVQIFAPDGRRVARLEGPAGPLVFSSGGVLAIGAPDGSVRLWRTGHAPVVLSGHSGPVTALAFSPDSKTLATASEDGTAALWDAETGAYRLPLDRGATAVMDVAFSPDGTRVLTANDDSDSRLWNAGSGQLLHRLRGHFFRVNSGSFSPDGRWIVTTSSISAALWIASTGRLLYYLRGHLGPVRSAEFSPGGRRVLTASDDGTVRVYACQLCGGIDELAALARTRLATR